MVLYKFYTSDYVHTVALRVCGIKSFIHVTTLVTLLYSQLSDTLPVIIINYYMLHAPSHNKLQMQFVYLWHSVCVVSWCFSTGADCCIFDFVEFLFGGKMTVHSNDNHNLFYHMDTWRSVMLHQSYAPTS